MKIIKQIKLLEDIYFFLTKIAGRLSLPTHNVWALIKYKESNNQN